MVGYSIKRIYSTALLAITIAPLLLMCGEVPYADMQDEYAMQGSSSTVEPSSDQEELHDADTEIIGAANVLLGFKGTSVETIAQQRGLSDQTVAQAVLYISENPETPLPSTNVSYTAEQITQAARNWVERKAIRVQQLAQLDKNKILRDTGVSKKELDQAFAYYRHYSAGALPTTRKRIQELARMYQNKLQRHKNYLARNKAEFAKIDTEEKIKEIAQREGVDEKIVRKAFIQYRRNSGGEPPITRERIQELARMYDEDLALHSERRKFNKADFAKIDTPQERQAIAEREGISLQEVEKAFAYYRIYPNGPLPTTRERIQELAKKRDEYLNKNREAQRLSRQRKRLAGKASTRAGNSAPKTMSNSDNT
ncbi:MAG: hypothetical protein K2X90_01300 [Candidatus Babeliaceae bacterium]|nr:hypothetical protein [Candidatus Babeliaceae bacterium]